MKQVQLLIEHNQLANILQQKYPHVHDVRTDKSLYDYVFELKKEYLRSVRQLDKVVFDNKLKVIKNILGTHSRISRVQGGKLKTKYEIRVSSMFKEMPTEFLRMIVLHELAHMKEQVHDKAFYQLCQHMEPNYHQFEFDFRVYLAYLETGGVPLWAVGKI